MEEDEFSDGCVTDVAPPSDAVSDHESFQSVPGSQATVTGSRGFVRGPYDLTCPFCNWTFASAMCRLIHVGLEHEVLCPRLESKIQDAPDWRKLIPIPCCARRSGGGGCEFIDDTIANSHKSGLPQRDRYNIGQAVSFQTGVNALPMSFQFQKNLKRVTTSRREISTDVLESTTTTFVPMNQ
eukprot:1934303-Amphidinium_carterae.1